MRQKTRRDILSLLGSTVLLASCAPAVVTRAGNDPFEGGIGGTGIVGVLTGFGSLLINGVTVDVARTTRYTTSFGATSLDALVPGMSLTVYAQRRGDRLVAKDVFVDHLLIGTLRGHQGALHVNGVSVQAPSAIHAHTLTGTRVAVSGVWSASGVIASRIDPAGMDKDMIAGTITPVDEGINGIGSVRLDAQGVRLMTGQYAAVMGTSNDEGFNVQSIGNGRFARATSLRNLSVEGYLEPINTQPGFRIAGLGHSFARDVSLGAIGARRAVYFGRYDGLFGASRGYIVPEDMDARRKLLNRGISEGFDGPVIEI